MDKGKLFLIPCTIAEGTSHLVIPAHVTNVLPEIKHFVVENVRTTRRFISSLKVVPSIEALNFSVLDKNTRLQDLDTLLNPLLEGHDVGVLSESGSPGIADPGSLAAQWAHQHDIRVIPLVGPSAVTLALMASGLNGQQFCFHGYLPVQANDLTKTIRELERESAQKKQTQIFIETPYRNNSMFAALVNGLKPDTWLCVACNVTGPTETITTRRIREWRLEKRDWPKEPALFLFLAA